MTPLCLHEVNCGLGRGVLRALGAFKVGGAAGYGEGTHKQACHGRACK